MTFLVVGTQFIHKIRTYDYTFLLSKPHTSTNNHILVILIKHVITSHLKMRDLQNTFKLHMLNMRINSNILF